jgi:chromosome segregation ATPase
MNPNTLELITNELAELNHLRLFKSKMVDKLFGDLTIPNYKPDDEDIFSCVQGLKNLSTGWDEEDEDGDIDLLAYHHPSYNQLKERVSKLSTGLVGGGWNHYIIPLKKENDELRLKVDALEKTIVEQKEDIEQYKDTLDEHLHHYDLLKENNEELKADLKVTREVEINGLCGYKTQINELKAENNSLQLQNESLLTNKTESQKIAQQKAVEKRKQNIIERNAELKELKAENKELKEFKQNSEKAFSSQVGCLEYRFKQNKKLNIELANHQVRLMRLQEENEKLKAENQDLQLRAPKPLEYYDDAIGNLESENKN